MMMMGKGKKVQGGPIPRDPNELRKGPKIPALPSCWARPLIPYTLHSYTTHTSLTHATPSSSLLPYEFPSIPAI